MSKRQKLIWQWRESPPTEEDVKKIRLVLEYFGFTIRPGGKHKMVASHPGLRDHPFITMGQITIPTVSGRKVKGFYVKRIVEALEYLGAFES